MASNSLRSPRPATRNAQAASGPSIFGSKMNVVPSTTVSLPLPPAQPRPPANLVATEDVGNVRQFLFRLNGTLKRSLGEQTREAIVTVTPQEMHYLVHAIARQRGRYLAGVLEAGTAARGMPTSAEVAQIRHAREAYEELRFGFEALKLALESGEIDFEASGSN